MLREQIKKDIAKAIKKSTDYSLQSTDIEVVRTADPKFGDYTTTVALRATRNAKRLTTNARKSYQSPLEFAKVLADSLKNLPYVKKLEVAGPGFINFFIKPEIWQEEVKEVLDKKDEFGSNNIGHGKKARIELVSANPTGPLHFGNARGGPIGDALASVLEFCGYKVIREYYHNDVGEQVRKLGQSVVNVASGHALEDQEYRGEYVKELAQKIGKVSTADEAGKRAVKLLLEEIIADCRDMGITFDEIYPESKFIERGATKKALGKIKKFLKEKGGAIWFAPTDEFLKDRETVVIKSDGNYTYFANDIAYHNLKFESDPDLVIDIFGANHHGHVPRLQAVIKALGYDVSKFNVVLYQWVRFINLETLEPVMMSKRLGTFVTAREVLDGVGRDALRFFILMHDPNSHIDFDLSLAMRKSKENPVYYVQYAHARIASILAKAGVQGKGFQGAFSTKGRGGSLKTDYALLTSEYELDLIKQITRLPELVSDIAQNFAVHRLTAYTTELADSFHRFYENCRVIGGKEDLMQARVGLIKATRIALANTLYLLGISAPEKM